MGDVERPSPPRDSLDLRTIRDGGRREIPWAHVDAQAEQLDARGRDLVGRSWRARMEQEHLAVGAFSLVAAELAREGCDSVVLAMITRAAADEVRHADVCRRLATRHLGESAVPRRVRGVPSIPEHAGASDSERVLLHVVEMCCLSETLTGVYLTEMLSRATHPVARAALESLLEDEIDHGRVGWAYLATRAREAATLTSLASALPAMLERTIGRVVDQPATDADEPVLEAHGYLAQRTARALYASALHEVILPGFTAIGVDLGPARAWVAERGASLAAVVG
jgi:hypothetical protein